VWWFWGRADGDASGTSDLKAFFTADDGASYFVGELKNVPPYQTTDGKTAYLAQVTQCGDRPPAVAYMEKYSPEDKRQMEADMGGAGAPGNVARAVMRPGLVPLVKRPLTGDKGWVRMTAQSAGEYQSIVNAACPDGSTPKRLAPPN
jgi:hypothetical protein